MHFLFWELVKYKVILKIAAMKIILVLLAVALSTNAAIFSDDDTDSPLVSYLLAKVQWLESKMMAKPNTWNTMPNNIRSTRPNIIRNSRSTKQTMARSVKTRSISVECKCPPSVVTYIRWGNNTYPYTV